MTYLTDDHWVPAISADLDHDDEEADLGALGNPGGASWAWVAGEDSQGWSWAIYSRWLWEDIDAGPQTVLAEGRAGSKDEAKRDVQAWLDALPGASHIHDSPTSLLIAGHYIMSSEELAFHLISAHADPLAICRPYGGNEDEHHREHARPGTIRNHTPASRIWDEHKIELVLAELEESP